MTSLISPMSSGVTKAEQGATITSEATSNLQPKNAALLPSIPEILIHLKLIDAIVCLKKSIEIQAEVHGVDAGEAWQRFCQAAAASFLEWSEEVDLSGKTIAVPPLHIMMIWHSYMLNTKDYLRFHGKTRRGGMSGKSFDWRELGRKLDLDYDGLPGVLQAWDLPGKTRATTPQTPGPAGHGFDMVAAVQRQLRFADKIHGARWRRPEVVNHFLSSAVGHYEEFFALIAENPGVGLAPTLAIDLVWHTHQLSPARYRAYSRHAARGRLVLHDDNLDGPALAEAGHSAERLYLARYGVPYYGTAGSPPPPPPYSPPALGRGPDAAGAPSCSSACSGGGCSARCQAGCSIRCRGGLCRDQCRAACGYVCGACETKGDGE